ncbi:hypothetical protein MTP99_019782 [Tenebrio molitor]|nr:hypothetical protein MTP99_019782 [Tenebrio molitor]
MEKSNEVPENILKKANLLREKLLPVKSKAAYEKVYASFCYWRENNKVSAVTEEVILAYLDEKQETLSPASLWPHYSMLKSSLKVKENLCIEKFCSVTAYLKQINVGHHAKKIEEAADETYLFVKAALIFGIAGACRRKELCDLTVNDIQDTGEVLIVTLRDTKTHLDRKFTIIGEGFVVNPLTIYRKYASLRPVNTSHDRFFLFYNNGKCTRQPVGINTFGQLPSKIAAYLKLEDPKTYTGHCFRRSSATLLAAGGGDLVSLKRHGGWRSSTVAEGYIEDCVEERIKIARKVFGGTTTTTTELSTRCGDVEGPKRVRLEEESRKSTLRRRGADLRIPEGRFVKNQTPECGVKFHARISSSIVGPRKSPRKGQVSRDIDCPVTIKARAIENIFGFREASASFQAELGADGRVVEGRATLSRHHREVSRVQIPGRMGLPWMFVLYFMLCCPERKKEKRGWVWVAGESTPELRRTKEKEEKADRKVPDRPVR